MLWGLTVGIAVSLESLFGKPKNVSPAGKLARQILLLIAFTFCSVLFRSQNIAEVGIAFRQMFTAFGSAEEAMDALGMSGLQLIELAVFIVGMSAVYRLPHGREESLPLTEKVAVNPMLYVYGVFAVALCWLGLLAMGDASVFQYFQF